MAARRGKVVAITPFTQSVGVNNGTFGDAYVKDWDKEAGAGQQIVRVKKRVREGARMTPTGQGVAVRTRS
jgi:hypothetical protein